MAERLALPTASGEIQQGWGKGESIRLGRKSQTYPLYRLATCKVINTEVPTPNGENKLDRSCKCNLPEYQLNTRLDCLQMKCQVTEKGNEERSKAVNLKELWHKPSWKNMFGSTCYTTRQSPK